MKALRFFPAVVTWMICGIISVNFSAADDQTALEGFIRHMGDLKVDNASSILEGIKAAQDPAEAVTSALSKIHPEYAAAVAASDDDDLNAALTKLKPFSTSDDKYLAADASFYLARTLMNHERFEEALPLLTELKTNLADYSTQTASVQYFIGQVQAGMLQNDQAIESLVEFLQGYPDAPERLRVSAWRQIQVLKNISSGQMDDVYHRMDFSRRRLEIIEAGAKTQEEQDKIVKMLAKLIQEQEKKECSSCNSKKNSENPSQSQQQAKNQPKESKSQSGGNSNNPNGKFVDKSFDTGNQSPWSRLRDMSRDPANAGIKDKLPARYKEIVERYNDAVNGNGEKTAEGGK